MWLVLLREAIWEVWGQPEENERVPKRDRGNRGSSTYIETSSQLQNGTCLHIHMTASDKALSSDRPTVPPAGSPSAGPDAGPTAQAEARAQGHHEIRNIGFDQQVSIFTCIKEPRNLKSPSKTWQSQISPHLQSTNASSSPQRKADQPQSSSVNTTVARSISLSISHDDLDKMSSTTASTSFPSSALLSGSTH